MRAHLPSGGVAKSLLGGHPAPGPRSPVGGVVGACGTRRLAGHSPKDSRWWAWWTVRGRPRGEGVGRAWAGGPGASRPGPEPSPRCAGSDHSVAPGAGPGLCQARLQPAGISVGSPGATSRPRWGLRFCGVGRDPGSSTTPPAGRRPLSVDAELPECGTNPRAEGWPGPGAVGEPAQACPSIPGSPP